MAEFPGRCPGLVGCAPSGRGVSCGAVVAMVCARSQGWSAREAGVALSGLEGYSMAEFPGRCPGLVGCAPSGQGLSCAALVAMVCARSQGWSAREAGVALSGLEGYSMGEFPGRCPGLLSCAPSG